jgi:hypothetical protein
LSRWFNDGLFVTIQQGKGSERLEQMIQTALQGAQALQGLGDVDLYQVTIQ